MRVSPGLELAPAGTSNRVAASAATDTANSSTVAPNATTTPCCATRNPASGGPPTSAMRCSSDRIDCTRASSVGLTMRGGSAPAAGRKSASMTPNTIVRPTSRAMDGASASTTSVTAAITSTRAASLRSAVRLAP
nr:hypothetical protein GCM10025699_63940 [Microbacterium flavescens]